MESIEKQILCYEVREPTQHDALSAHQSSHIFLCYNPIPRALAPDNSGQRDTNDPAIGNRNIAIDNSLDISQFFDFEKAALDPDRPDSPPTTGTLHSKASNKVPLFPDEPLPYSLPYIVPNIEAGDVGSTVAIWTPTPSPPGNPWPIEHLRIHAPPHATIPLTPIASPDNAMQTPNTKKRVLEEDIPGLSCFESGIPSKSTKKQKKWTEEQRRVRVQGACLRCYVQKLKCSEGRPCDMCQALFNKAYGSKSLKWTACISSNLPDINIFTLGISLCDDGSVPATKGVGSLQKWNVPIAASTYNLIFGLGYCSGSVSYFDTLYTEVMRYTYGHCAPEVHPFILKERNPLYMLIQLNVILLGSPIIGHKLIGHIRYLQKLRAICGVIAFESLGKALNRTALAASTPTRHLALVIQAALLLDQVVEMNREVPAAMVCLAQDSVYEEMHRHLVEFICHYLMKLLSGRFGKKHEILACLKNATNRESLSEAFWDMLSDLIPSMSLRKPPKVRKYADMSWDLYDPGMGQLYHRMFSSPAPIPCY